MSDIDLTEVRRLNLVIENLKRTSGRPSSEAREFIRELEIKKKIMWKRVGLNKKNPVGWRFESDIWTGGGDVD